jgi:hypothetical protein
MKLKMEQKRPDRIVKRATSNLGELNNKLYRKR